MYNVSFPALGLDLTINPVAFSVGGFEIYWYGICIALGMSLGLVYFFFASKKVGIDSDRGLDVIIVSGIAAIIGARVYYVIFSPYPMDGLLDMIDIRDGGVAIYGSIIGAFLVGIPMCKFRKVPLLPMFDVAALGFLIGQAVGRWGNFFNQEAFGTNTDSIFGMYSEGTNRYLNSILNNENLAALASNIDPNAPVHPTFLYESIWCLLCFIGLAFYLKHRKFNGELFLLYILLYSAERAVVEGLRTDSLMIFNARVSQLLAIALCIAALVILIVFYTSEKLRSKKAFVLLPEFVPTAATTKGEEKEEKATKEVNKLTDEIESIEDDVVADITDAITGDETDDEKKDD